MKTNYSSRQAGFSLVELLVAIVLGAFLVLGVVNVFTSTKQSSVVENALARIQENGRLAVELISSDLHKAHYSGCNSVGGIVDVVATGVTFEGVRGFERAANNGVWAPDPTNAVLTPISGIAREGSDVLSIQLATSVGQNLLTADLSSNDGVAKLSANPDCALGTGDLVLVSSCLTAHMFRVTNTVSCTDPTAAVDLEFDTTANLPLPIEPGYRYTDQSEIMEFEAVTWFVADTGRDLNGQDVFALYRSSNGVAEEMLEGVEYLQLEYGQRVGDQMRYVNALDASLDWEEVVAVRFAILLQGFDRIRDQDDTEPYNLLGTTILATGDGAHSGGPVLRRVFSTTATMRNRPYDI